MNALFQDRVSSCMMLIAEATYLFRDNTPKAVTDEYDRSRIGLHRRKHDFPDGTVI